jgi:hypothetical protein
MSAAWRRCLACGSDSSDAIYEPSLYDSPTFREAPRELAIQGFANVVGLLQRHARGKLVLDVGTYDGMGRQAMEEAGYETWGFDVNPHAAGDRVTIASSFSPQLFNITFDAVVSCEEIEHVDKFEQHLRDLHEAISHLGLLVIQTPTPLTDTEHQRFADFYCRGHLQLFSPAMLDVVVKACGFMLIEHYVTEGTQCAAFRRV